MHTLFLTLSLIIATPPSPQRPLLSQIICHNFMKALEQDLPRQPTPSAAEKIELEEHIRKNMIASSSSPLLPGLFTGPFWTEVARMNAEEFTDLNDARNGVRHTIQGVHRLFEDHANFDIESPFGPLKLNWTPLQAHIMGMATHLAYFLPAKDKEKLIPGFSALATLIGDPRVNQASLQRWLFGFLSTKISSSPNAVVEELAQFPAAAQVMNALDASREIRFAREFAFYPGEVPSPSFDFFVVSKATGNIDFMFEVKTLTRYQSATDLSGPINQTLRKIKSAAKDPARNSTHHDQIEIILDDREPFTPAEKIQANLTGPILSDKVVKILIVVTPWERAPSEDLRGRRKFKRFPNGDQIEESYDADGHLRNTRKRNLFDLSANYLNRHPGIDKIHRLWVVDNNGVLIVRYRRGEGSDENPRAPWVSFKPKTPF